MTTDKLSNMRSKNNILLPLGAIVLATVLCCCESAWMEDVYEEDRKRSLTSPYRSYSQEELQAMYLPPRETPPDITAPDVQRPQKRTLPKIAE
jgi:hypothetical protein